MKQKKIRRFSMEAYGWFNNSTHLCYEASRSCVNGALNPDYEAQLLHVKNRINVGHESVIEHSNFVMAIIVPDEHLSDLVSVLSCCKYLETETKRIAISTLPNIFTQKRKIKKVNAKETENATLVNIAGSIRGWKHIYRNIEDIDTNRVLMVITRMIYTYLPKEYFMDFIADGIMTEECFHPQYEEVNPYFFENQIDDYKKEVDIINVDKPDNLLSHIPAEYIIEKTGFDMTNLLTITVDFVDMSRFTTHQLVRHRNGITQSSQRYIDFSKAGLQINNPFKYDTKDQAKDSYDITFAGSTTSMKFEDLLENLGDIYVQLKDQGMKNECARACAPQAMAAGHVYMTFTLKHLLKFLELRTHVSAQAEIRHFANELYSMISTVPFLEKYFVKDDDENFIGLYPVYKLLNIKNIENGDQEEDILSETISDDEEYVLVDKDPNSPDVEKIKVSDIPIGTSKNEDV